MESKTVELMEIDGGLVVPGWRVGEMGDGGHRVPSSRYKMKKFWECDVQHPDYSYYYCIIYLKVDKE